MKKKKKKGDEIAATPVATSEATKVPEIPKVPEVPEVPNVTEVPEAPAS